MSALPLTPVEAAAADVDTAVVQDSVNWSVKDELPIPSEGDGDNYGNITSDPDTANEAMDLKNDSADKEGKSKPNSRAREVRLDQNRKVSLSFGVIMSFCETPTIAAIRGGVPLHGIVGSTMDPRFLVLT